MKLNTARKLILLLIGLSTFYSIGSSALTISNYNTKDIMVEVMDCESYYSYGYPSEQSHRCSTIGSSKTCTASNNLNMINFLNLSHIKPNDQMTLNKDGNSTMPGNVCVHIAAASGGIYKEVKNSCEIRIYDNGFLNGVKAEYDNDCF